MVLFLVKVTVIREESSNYCSCILRNINLIVDSHLDYVPPLCRVHYHFKEKDTLSLVYLSKFILSPSEKGSTPKGKNLLPFLEHMPF